MSKYFAVTAPGFEAELESEIKMFHSVFGWDEGLKILATQKGGVEFESPFSESVYFNQYSKLATRLLIRWDEFHCVFFSDLEKKLKQRSLSKWFKNKSRIFVKVNSKKSKLGQEKKIFEVFKRVYVDFELIPKASEAEEDDYTLFVDFFEDMCTLSIDTSGPALYKRSMDKKVSFGSMRETIAHWALNKMVAADSPWKAPTVLIDPFAGSGTLLLESQNAGINKKREFTFQKLKAFADLKPLVVGPKQFSALPFVKFVGIESDPETFDILKSNMNAFPSADRLTLLNIKNEDYKDSHAERVWIFSNLPYGKQVKSDNLKNMIQTMKSVFKPQLLAVFHPEPIKDKEALSALHSPVINGGLKINLSILVYAK
jgi:putative N6-adenine-specific DNA methylase